jgi:hypothetical protein
VQHGVVAVTKFVGEKIDVEKGGVPPQPVSFKWRGQTYAVTEVLREWVDAGFGSLPPASRVWYNRRHRRYYTVRASTGEVFTLYFDYAHRKSPTWWLVSSGDESDSTGVSGTAVPETPG